MRSASSPSAGSSADQTARARIRDAAVVVVGQQGVRAPVRAIAVHAGVSPALVIHHFGSKAALLAECDAHVLAQIRAAKEHQLLDAEPGAIVDLLASTDEYLPLLGYAVRSLQAGGAMARTFVDQLAADAAAYTERAVAAGVMRPSRDPHARARLMILQNLGALMLVSSLASDTDDVDPRAAMTVFRNELTLPALEILTEGVLTDATMLETFVDQMPARGEP